MASEEKENRGDSSPSNLRNLLIKTAAILFLSLAVAFSLTTSISFFRDQISLKYRLQGMVDEMERQVELEKIKQEDEHVKFLERVRQESKNGVIPEAEIDFLDYSPDPTHAIITMMGSNSFYESYWMGVVSLVASMRLVKSRVPNFVVLLRETVPPFAHRVLQKLNVTIIPIQDIKKASHLEIPGVWGSAWSKLQIWKMTEFSKALFMDADTMVVNNIDHLLLEPELSAPWTPFGCRCEPEFLPHYSDYFTLSSGFFVFQPNTSVYDWMMDLASKPSPDKLDQEQFGGNWHWGDQEMLRVVFQQFQNKWHPLNGQVYDCPIGLCDCKGRRKLSRSYHFTCSYPVPKPWGNIFRPMYSTFQSGFQGTSGTIQLMHLWLKYLSYGFGFIDTYSDLVIKKLHLKKT